MFFDEVPCVLAYTPHVTPSDTARDTRRGALIVISGPSGVGKTTIVRAVKERLGGIFSVSATTRPQTAQEEDGVDYFFLTEDQFQTMIDEDQLLEYAQVFGKHRYGTPRGPVEEALADGKLVILEIDVQGALQVRKSAPDTYMMFILPPTEAALLARLQRRGRDDDEAIQRRFGEAKREIARAKASGAYDAVVTNDDLDIAQSEACSLIKGRLQGARAKS